MNNPFLIMTFLYIAMGVLAALDAALVSLSLLPAYSGLRWLRVHFITLGALTEFAFGILPIVVARRHRLPRPPVRWDTWLVLNLGLVTLIAGIPLVNAAMITAGGTLVFIAVLMLMAQLGRFPALQGAPPTEGRNFYLAALLFLLVGIIVGTGLWQNWLPWLQIKTPLEVHIHANNWGFMSLLFAGLIVDSYPRITGRDLAWPGVVTPVFLAMTTGALLLVLGPWFQSVYFTVPGILLHIGATLTLLAAVVKPLVGTSLLRTPGMLHLLTSYLWILLPVFVAPLILLNVPGFPGAGIEASAPQALIYGWVLQFGYAVIPYFFRRLLQPDSPPRLGGTWFSLAAAHLGGVVLWASIFVTGASEFLHGLAYLLWAFSMIPIARELWRIVSAGIEAYPSPSEPSGQLPEGSPERAASGNRGGEAVPTPAP